MIDLKKTAGIALLGTALTFTGLGTATTAFADSSSGRCSVSSSASADVRCELKAVPGTKAPAFTGKDPWGAAVARFRQAINPQKKAQLCSGGMIIKPGCR